VASLPPYYAARVRRNIEVPDLDSARATVTELRTAAERCASEPTPTPTPTPTPAPSIKPTPVPSGATATNSVAVTPSPRPTAAPTQPEC